MTGRDQITVLIYGLSTLQILLSLYDFFVGTKKLQTKDLFYERR